MESPVVSSPVQSTFGPQSSSHSSSTKLDDVTSLTSFNPFAEEDENDQSSLALVSQLFSRMRNSLSVPLSSTAPAPSTSAPTTSSSSITAPEARRPSLSVTQLNTPGGGPAKPSSHDRPHTLSLAPTNPAPPLVSLTPVTSEAPTYHHEVDSPMVRNGSYAPVFETPDGGSFATAIPGFPIQDDARSIRTSMSISMPKQASVSKVIRRIRGEGLSKEYWMDDESCQECYDCKSVFTAWRRKHHCRICGYIFCSRCASNVIKGARFGHDGMIRVCNLCLDKLANVDDDDDDDRRSISSFAGSFAGHQMGADGLQLSRSISNLPQSPFAASQLFGRSADKFNLYSIAETKRPPISGGSEDVGSRPTSLDADDYDSPKMDGESKLPNPAPFRRNVADEDKDHQDLDNPFSEDSPNVVGSKTPVEFPISIQVPERGSTNFIQFPVSSPDRLGIDSPGGLNTMRTRLNSYADDPYSPFIRSRVQSRLGSFGAGEPGWRTRRESTAYAQELNITSMYHLRVMLRQMLKTEQIPNIKEWEETLLKMALRIARELTFTTLPHRQGEDMDVRRYVKIKKIPGGAPRDSEYVDGAVITKNVAHKKMHRLQPNPRVMLVTFPLEYHRVEGQYMHFGQIYRQEKEALGNLVSRIAALRPHVVLVEKSVSRLAMEALADANIAVARAVKPSAIRFVARMTQADVFSSIDKLALEPRLGHCTAFRIQTFDHPLIPGQRKTYMRFEGCSRDMGCTIVLRGGDIATLRRVKKVTRFLTFIVRNLKLETHLWKDSIITLKSLGSEATPGPTAGRSGTPVGGPPPNAVLASKLSGSPTTAPPKGAVEAEEHDLPDEDAEQVRLSRRIQRSLEPYSKTFISVSATLRFPPPHPLQRMKELDDELQTVKREWEDEIVRREERQATPPTAPSLEPELKVSSPRQEAETSQSANDVKAQIDALVVPSIPVTPRDDHTPRPESSLGYFDLQPMTAIAACNSATPVPLAPLSAMPSPLVSPLPLPASSESCLKLKSVDDIALESKLGYIKGKHDEQRRIWDWYLRKNKDDFLLEQYQCLCMWEFTVPFSDFGHHRPCQARFAYITFYGENDCTLGQYIEKAVSHTLDTVFDPKAVCEEEGCGQLIARHCKVYVHYETRLSVVVEQWDGQINHYGAHELITTWSVCRVCGSATPFIPVSEEMQRYSFAKFLELHFYPADVQLVQGAGCQHNIYQHHIRFFALQGMTVRFQADPIVLKEIVYPPMRIRVRPETQLELKNVDFERLHHQNFIWYMALVDDLRLIGIDAATGDDEVDAAMTAEINALVIRAEAEREEIDQLLHRTYNESPPTDTLALNQVRAYRQDKIVAWQSDFDRLMKAKPHLTLDKGGRRNAQLPAVRAMWPRRRESAAHEDPHLPSSYVSEAEEARYMSPRRVTGDSFASTASDASEAENVGHEEATATSGLPATIDSMISESTVQAEANFVPSKVPEKSTSPREGQPIFELPASHKSGSDSDSTIGASRRDKLLSGDENISPTAMVQPALPFAQPVTRVSRLPKSNTQNPSVADLVKKYSDFLPSNGMQELAKSALAPGFPISESDQEYEPVIRISGTKTRHRHPQPTTKTSTSDFEQSYAANIAPRYLTHGRRSMNPINKMTRIPVPVVQPDPTTSLRESSPEKRTSTKSRTSTDGSSRLPRASSPPSSANNHTVGGKPPKGKIPARVPPKEKSSFRAPSFTIPSAGKSTLRRGTVNQGTKVGNIARHFEKINKETERSNRRYAVIRGKRARPVASARAKVEIFDSIKDAIKDDESESSDSSEADDEGEGDEEGSQDKSKSSDLSPESSLDNSLASVSNDGISSGVQSTSKSPAAQLPAKEGSHDRIPDVNGDLAPATKDHTREIPAYVPASPLLTASANQSTTPPTSDLDITTGAERLSIMKALSGLWPQHFPPPRANLDFEADDPMNDPEHIFRDSSMVVRTDEPTSIIALALNSPQYREMLGKSRADKRIAKEPQIIVTNNEEAFMPDDKSLSESGSTWGVVNLEGAESASAFDELRMPSSKLPWAISFESGGLTISCTVLYPEQFDALRRTFGCDKNMVESLARCVTWHAGGGKSGSAFLKTQDDRFIAKELSRAELQTMETFAPAYFDHMSSVVSANRPSLLAKVFGCFKLTFRKTSKDKNGNKSKITQMNLLVMENLFYNRRFSKIFDLKGSRRNRHVQSTGRENEVLLDENLRQTQHLAPFYLREHSKRILRGALSNDSRFLADINVMDYSLVVGVDSQSEELVVGIVDYIRTYTWDKRMESWVKESAFLGGGNKGEPTIVTPKQYRERFLGAMEGYFPLVPDRWMKQKDTPEKDNIVVW